MILKTEEQLLQFTKETEKILIYGVAAVWNTMMRFFTQNQVSIAGIVSEENYEKSYFGFSVKALEEFANFREKYGVVVCARPQQQEELEKKAVEMGFSSVSVVDYELYLSISWAENMHLDFLCGGFSKAGTTSLQSAFKKHPNIQLPINKESYYLVWRDQYDNSPKRFKDRYFPELQEGKLIGNIEPAYSGKAVEAYECFGKDLKIILMLRNPIDATYSIFKMLMKNPNQGRQAMYYRKYGKFHVDMFNDFIEDYIFGGIDDRYLYIKYVKEYMELFGKDQVKLVIFEELIREPERVLNEVQDFVGAPRKKYKKLPRSNEGKFVSKNFPSAIINCALYKKKIAMKTASVKQMKRYWKVANFVHKHTYVENAEKMSEKSREVLKDFYKDSVKELSELSGRDFGEFWKDFQDC